MFLEDDEAEIAKAIKSNANKFNAGDRDPYGEGLVGRPKNYLG